MSDADLDRIVGGARKNARNQIYRYRMSRYGLKANGRAIENIDAAAIASRPESNADADSKDLARQLEVVRTQIREYAKNDRRRLLIEARLLRGLPLTWLADRLGVLNSTARSIIRRAKLHLNGD